MSFLLSPTIRKAVFERIQRAGGDGRYMNVYEAAQEVQNEHPRENIALEDIVAALVDAATGKSVALEFSQTQKEGLIPIEVIARQTPE